MDIKRLFLLIFDYISKGFLKPEMTVKQIRDIIKLRKNGDKPTDDVIEDLNISDKSDDEEPEEEPFYNPNKHYEQEFFEGCSHSQLVSMILALQFEFEKIKNK